MKDGVIELALHRDPCNEIGSLSLDELENFSAALDSIEKDAHALIIHSELKSGFCAGADLRELYERSQTMEKSQAAQGVRDFLERIHRVLNRIDAAPLTTIAAVHGVTFGGGFELALVCDLIIADKMARFCFPELRLGLIPGIRRNPAPEARSGQRRRARPAADRPQFQRHQGAADRPGKSGCLRKARLCARREPLRRRSANSTGNTAMPPSNSSSRFRYEELRREIDIFCELFSRPAVQAGLEEICGEHGRAALFAVKAGGAVRNPKTV